jgi:uncharacterized protein
MTQRKHLIVSLHDLHRRSFPDVSRQKQLLSDWGVETASVLVVPEYHHDRKSIELYPRLIEQLCHWQDKGYELVPHGFYHDRYGMRTRLKDLFMTRFYTNNEAEFLDLPIAEAEARVKRGRNMFSRFGWNTYGFIAPGWLMSPRLPEALRRLGYLYTNTLTEIIPLHGEKPAPSESTQSLCYSTRARWRRHASLLWNQRLFSQLRKTSVIRLSLHPRDFLYKPLRTQIEHFVKTALKEDFQPTTYADYVTG